MVIKGHMGDKYYKICENLKRDMGYFSNKIKGYGLQKTPSTPSIVSVNERFH